MPKNGVSVMLGFADKPRKQAPPAYEDESAAPAAKAPAEDISAGCPCCAKMREALKMLLGMPEEEPAEAAPMPEAGGYGR